MNRFSVVFVARYFPPSIGGAASRDYNIYLNLKKIGVNCKVLTFSHLNKKGNFPNDNIWNFTVFTFYSLFGFLVASIMTSYQVLMISSPPITTGILAPFARFLKKYVVADIQDIWPDSLVEEGYLRKDSFLYVLLSFCESLTYRHANKIITVSPLLADDISQRARRKDIFVLLSGANMDIFRPKSSDPNLKVALSVEGKKVILYSGKIGKAQQLENVLFGLAEAVKQYPKIVCLIVGAGEEVDSLKQLSSKLGLDNHVKFLPPVSQRLLVDYIAISDVCIVPLHESEKGALPTKFFEYLSCGKPVLALSSVDIGKILGDSEAGLFILNPSNKSLIAKSLARLLTNDKLRVQMGKSGRQYSLKNLNFSDSIAKLVHEIERSI